MWFISAVGLSGGIAFHEKTIVLRVQSLGGRFVGNWRFPRRRQEHIGSGDMKKRSLSGNVGVGVFLVAFVCVCVAFGTPSWLVSDPRIIGAQFDRLGLWRHCFRSLPNPQESDAPRRFFVGCRWVYDPFTAGYSEIRGFLLPRKYLQDAAGLIQRHHVIPFNCKS